MKICKVIFSTNRLRYLVRTLDSFRKLDFGDHEVDGIFVDDYPKGRDNDQITAIAKHYGYNRIVLHEENVGLTGTWAEVNQMLSEKQYDYIWQQEDDVELLVPLHINTCIDLLLQDTKMAQVSLKRQAWYPGEDMGLLDPSDQIFGDFKYNTIQRFFWTMATCYPYWISQEQLEKETGCQPSESMLMFYLVSRYNCYSSVLKMNNGSEIVNHIGEVTKGKRISKPGDPSYERFLWMDPNKRYSARDGREIGDNEDI